MKWIYVLLLSANVFAQTTITGTFRNPDATTLTGRAVVSITRPTIINKCSTPYQVTASRPVTVAINAGTLGTLSLLAGPCMVAQHTPAVQPGNGIGAGGTASLTSGTDLQATVSVHTGVLPSNIAPVATITFVGGPYTPSPLCIVVGPANSNTKYLATKSYLQLTATLSASTTYSFSYYCQVTPYLAKIYDASSRQLYMGNWIVPNQGSADTSVLDPR